MTATTDITSLLPTPLPACYNSRILLFAIRRMAAHGLNDAHAAHALLGWFGLGFRRPLVLLRALMAEVSRVSERRLAVAPCCCRRMTRSEAALIAAIQAAPADAAGTHDALRSLTGTRHCLGALSSAQALAQAFGDLGRPLEVASTA